MWESQSYGGNTFPEGITYEAESVYNAIMLIHTDNDKKICQLYFQLDFSHNYVLVVFSSGRSDNSVFKIRQCNFGSCLPSLC